MQVYVKQDGSSDIVETRQVHVDDLTMAEVIVRAANSYARNVETMGSQPKEFSL